MPIDKKEQKVKGYPVKLLKKTEEAAAMETAASSVGSGEHTEWKKSGQNSRETGHLML